MIREFFAKRTNAPQPVLMFALTIWAIGLYCVFYGTRPRYGWYVLAIAALDTVYAGWCFWSFYGGRKTR
jgi:hypothetical protein